MSELQDHKPTTGPYATAAHTYWRRGWRGVLPLPPRRKGPVPPGWTGNDGAWPSYPDVHAWTEAQPDSNIGLRLPPGVIGVDVDMYDSKPGYLVLQALQADLGPLPPTWHSTSRSDGMSGIRLYRIPEGLRWPSVLGPGIDVLRTGHRYAVVWPSIHPDTGGTYRWVTPDGATALEGVPSVDDLPDLPDAWVEYFTHGEAAGDQPRAELTEDAAGRWLAGRGAGGQCLRMESAVQRAQTDLAGGGSRHDAALSGTNRLVWLAGEGHPGAGTGLAALQDAFLVAVAGDRAAGDAQAEWDRMVSGAVRIAAAAHPDVSPDPCDDPTYGLVPKDTTRNAPAATAATAAADADDLTEAQVRRNQATNLELERQRMQRQAQRTLEREDEDAVVGDRVRRKILDDKAAVEFRRQTEPPAPPFDAGSLAEILARPPDPAMRVSGLIPWTGSTLIVAQRKTGKTTLQLNWARVLITGERFLGEFDVIPLPPEDRVAYLNFEVSGAQLARWASEMRIPHDRLYLVNLRGRRNPLNHKEDRAALAQRLREQRVQSVIVDPFGRAYTGQSQNDNGEVQAFLLDLEVFVREEVGALDLMLATHAGWDGERTRGASALEDWGDVVITMTRDAENDDRRYLRAMGRDVDVEEDELAMGPDRMLVRTGGGSRKVSKAGRETAGLAVLVVRAAHDQPGCSKARMAALITEMDDAPDVDLGPGRGDTRLKDAILHAERSGRLKVERGGPGRPDKHFEVTTTTTTAPPPGGGPETTTTTVYKEVVVVGGSPTPLSTNGSGGGSDPHRIVERVIAGERARVNLDTGETWPA